MAFVAALVFGGASRMRADPPVTLPSASGPITTSVAATATESPVPPTYDMLGSAAPAPENAPVDTPGATTPTDESANESSNAPQTPMAPTQATPPNHEPHVRTASASPHANPTPAPQAPEAKLIFAIAPWGEIYVDGHRVGVTPPLRELSVPAGRRKVEIRNADLAPHVVMLDLHEHSAVKIKYEFR